MAALSQLSYGPLVPSKCSREVEVVSPIDAAPLIVQARTHPKCDGRPTLDASDRNEEAPIEFEVVRSDRIDLIGGVRPSDEPLSASARTLATDDQYFPPSGGPLALHAEKARFQIENHVAATTLRHWAVNIDVELGCREGDGHLRDGAFLIRCHASQRTDRLGWAVAVSDKRHRGLHFPRREQGLTSH
jgi:hypothetical protein